MHISLSLSFQLWVLLPYNCDRPRRKNLKTSRFLLLKNYISDPVSDGEF